jgi:hypothetical protein
MFENNTGEIMDIPYRKLENVWRGFLKPMGIENKNLNRGIFQ